jgi:DNA-binding winged helix-turn-helix (wHTH) protein
MAGTKRGTLRFGVFEVDLRAGELRKQGVKIKLQKQPFQILQMLLECPGEVITREEMRKAVGDSAGNPRFNGSVPGRGYRLIGTVGGGPERIESLAVLPLENLSHDPEQDYFADGLTEALITSLAKINALRVVSRTSVMRYKGVHDKSLREIASELGVDGIAELPVVPAQ